MEDQHERGCCSKHTVSEEYKLIELEARILKLENNVHSIKIEKINDEVEEPKYESDDASGMDVKCLEECKLEPGETKLFKLGFKVEIPSGYEIQVRPRSGLALKYGLTVLNSPGTIDSDYRGEVGVILHNASQVPYVFYKGERIAQIVLCKVEKICFYKGKVNETDRGEGGLGSTGRK